MRDVAGRVDQDALLLSISFGIINFLFAFFAVWTINSFGHRNLLLSTFAFMALFQTFNAIAFALFKRSTVQHTQPSRACTYSALSTRLEKGHFPLCIQPVSVSTQVFP
jgi:uncharacterized membrane protein